MKLCSAPPTLLRVNKIINIVFNYNNNNNHHHHHHHHDHHQRVTLCTLPKTEPVGDALQSTVPQPTDDDDDDDYYYYHHCYYYGIRASY